MISQILSQLAEIERNIHNNHSPQMLFMMNKKYRELQEELKAETKKLEVEFCVVPSGYEYTCKCGHEFDFDDGVKSTAFMTYVCCPVCGTLADVVA